MAKKVTEDVALAVMANDIQYIKEAVGDINDKLSKEFVTKTEFDPVKRIVYGLVTLILVGVIGAVLGLVIIK